mmetsp:Transcript_13475/g.36719  ORF Transcript_13475/g.36719 Transcript_13475/m.36719 type:complete len:288 (-) Transcript_13475:1061-1924(-)
MLRKEQVLGLEITVNDAALVQVLESKDGSSNVVLSVFLTAMEGLAVVGGIELSTKCRLEQKVKRLRAIVGLVQLDDKFRVCHHQYVLLVHDTVLHACLDDVALAQTLHGVGISSLLVLPQLHGTEAATAQKTDPSQVLPQDLALALVLAGSPGPALAFASRAVLLVPRALHDVLQGTQQHIEGVTVEHEGLCGIRGHLHCGPAHFVVLERAFAEVLCEAPRRARRQDGDARSILDDVHCAIVEDVKGGARLALLNDHFALGEMHLDQCLGEFLFLLSKKRGQTGHAI